MRVRSRVADGLGMIRAGTGVVAEDRAPPYQGVDMGFVQEWEEWHRQKVGWTRARS